MKIYTLKIHWECPLCFDRYPYDNASRVGLIYGRLAEYLEDVVFFCQFCDAKFPFKDLPNKSYVRDKSVFDADNNYISVKVWRDGKVRLTIF